MENVAPPLLYISTVCFGLENGTAFRTVFNQYIDKYAGEAFTRSLVRIAAGERVGRDTTELVEGENSSIVQSLLELTYIGLRGESVLDHFRELEKEVRWHCDQVLEEHLRLLPLKISMPILLLQVPAYLILLFGPLLVSLSLELSK